MNIPFIIGLIIVFSTMIYATVLVLCNKVTKRRNKVHFYIVQFEIDGKSVKSLWLGLPYWDSYNKVYRDNNFKTSVLAYGHFLKYYGIDLNNYSDMKDGDIREVFLNLED